MAEFVLFQICISEAIGEEHYTSMLTAMFQMEDVSKLVNSFLPDSLQKKPMITLQTIEGWAQPCDGDHRHPISRVGLTEYKIE
jgi:hypothetical protein